MELPRIDIPFRFSKGQMAANEQGSEADVLACVKTVLLVQPGDLADDPGFGLPDLTFDASVNPQAIVGPLSTYEPRAKATAEVNQDALAEAIAEVTIKVGG